MNRLEQLSNIWDVEFITVSCVTSDQMGKTNLVKERAITDAMALLSISERWKHKSKEKQ